MITKDEKIKIACECFEIRGDHLFWRSDRPVSHFKGRRGWYIWRRFAGQPAQIRECNGSPAVRFHFQGWQYELKLAELVTALRSTT